MRYFLLEKKLENKFKKYAYCYDMKDENITRKYYHSIRVEKFAKNIALFEKVSHRNIKLAIISGILHDYARFEQWKQYKTYSDIDSVDHGDLAVKMLFDNKEIYNFYSSEKDFNSINIAIKYHNKISVPEFVKNDDLVLCNIIRDADKLDIFNILIENKNLFKEDSQNISDKVDDDFFNMKNINRHDVKNESDNIILCLAMFYDFNFKYSYKYIIENKILEKLYNTLENKDKFKKYFDFIQKYLEKCI